MKRVLIFVGAGVLTTACARVPATQPLTNQPPASATVVPAGTDSIVRLRFRSPSDSVVLHRGGTTFLLSLEDLEEYFTSQPTLPELDSLHRQIRRQFAEEGWVLLGNDRMIDVIASVLLRDGCAAVRDDAGGEFLPWVRMVEERQSRMSGGAVDYRLFYAPNGRLLLRVIDAIAVS
jgi:hypothetical protein